MNGGEEIREVEATMRAAIADAERFIYIENQYLTADAIREALVARMRQCPALEVMAVVPCDHAGWLEKKAPPPAPPRTPPPPPPPRTPPPPPPHPPPPPPPPTHP